MLNLNDLKMENWVKVYFYPEENDKYEKVFKDACFEVFGEGYEVDEDCVREDIDDFNTHIIWINKDSLHMLETFVDDVGDDYFYSDLDIAWDIYEDASMDCPDDKTLLKYNEDEFWFKFDEQYKILMF